MQRGTTKSMPRLFFQELKTQLGLFFISIFDARTKMESQPYSFQLLLEQRYATFLVLAEANFWLRIVGGPPVLNFTTLFPP